jgi:hypothetical protein
MDERNHHRAETSLTKRRTAAGAGDVDGVSINQSINQSIGIFKVA